jgi:hypothetical protein
LKKITLESEESELHDDYLLLIAKWRGNSPSQIAKLIEIEFNQRFHSPIIRWGGVIFKGSLHEFSYRMLIPEDNKWATLITKVLRCMRIWKFVEEINEFFWAMHNVVMGVIGSSKTRIRNKYRKKERELEKFTPNLLWGGVCQLCWRSVEIFHDRCHMHKYNSRSKEYRRRKRLAAKGRISISGKEYSLESLFKFLHDKSYKNEERLSHDFIINEDDVIREKVYVTDIWADPITRDFVTVDRILKLFPNTLKYLEERFVNTKSFAEVVAELEATPDDEPGYVAKARQEYFEDVRWHMSLATRYFARVEAWLMMEAAHPWGGIRTGSGRKLMASNGLK